MQRIFKYGEIQNQNTNLTPDKDILNAFLRNQIQESYSFKYGPFFGPRCTVQINQLTTLLLQYVHMHSFNQRK